MKNDEIIEQHVPTPTLKKLTCKLFAKTIEYFLHYSAFVVSLYIWYMYDYFIAGSSFILFYIVIGIVRSKLRNSSIPFSQREYTYNDKEVSIWYTTKYLC
jgi:hypothetical protein